MTRQLKELMHEATDRAAFTPDIDRLLTTGRRQTRKRRLLTVAAAAVSIAVVAGGTVFALDTTRGSAPTPAPADRATEGGSSGLCTDNTGGGLDAWRWPAFLSVQDTFGFSTVRHSPKNPQTIAFCTTEWGLGAKNSLVPGGGKQVLVRKSPAIGRGLAQPGSVTTVFGVVPAGVQRVTVETNDGHLGVATIKAGYFAYRRVEQTPWPGPLPSVIVRFKAPGQPEYVAPQR